MHTLLTVTAGIGAQVAKPDSMLEERSQGVNRPNQPDGPFFYHGLGYGSDAYMGPLDVVMNKGLALAQTDYYDKHIFDYDYGWSAVGDALIHPVAAIQRAGGWWDFIRKELLPISYHPDDVKWYPNYTGHLLEGGIHYRRLAEWFSAHDVPLPYLLSAVTSVGSAVLNEAWEHPGGSEGAAGIVADIYVFDLGGILLFSHDGVARFFSHKLRTTIWPGQASFTLPSREVQNNTAYMTFKFPWGPFRNTSLFFHTGLSAGLGLTFHRANGIDVTAAIGTDAQRMRVDEDTGIESVELGYAAWLFIDRNNSLLASAHFSQLEHRMLKLNVYPGVLGGFARDFGLWAVITRDREVRFGISNRYWLGAGLGLGGSTRSLQ